MILPGEVSDGQDAGVILKETGFDSVASYVWIQSKGLAFPTTDYGAYLKCFPSIYSEIAEKYPLPYFPNVTVGWDSSPRTCMSDRYDNLGYPFMGILTNNTPDNFYKALANAKDYLLKTPSRHKMLTINAWNEWTEGSYLEPDTENGYGYLEAIGKCFQK
jgi:hypothetical protein